MLTPKYVAEIAWKNFFERIDEEVNKDKDVELQVMADMLEEIGDCRAPAVMKHRTCCRRGEAICWHIAQSLLPDNKEYKPVTIDELKTEGINPDVQNWPCFKERGNGQSVPC